MTPTRLEPAASRPGFPGYGIVQEEDGMLPWRWADERLAAGRNYWVSTAGADGRPHAMPVWGVWLGDGVYFGTSPGSRKGRNLGRDPRCVVHLESGDEVVILEGEAEAIPLDKRVADAYQEKYRYRPNGEGTESEGWFRLRPRIAYAWLERDYPKTATRFSFQG